MSKPHKHAELIKAWADAKYGDDEFTPGCGDPPERLRQKETA